MILYGKHICSCRLLTAARAAQGGGGGGGGGGKLINKEIWLVRGSYCHCQHVMTFFFWSSTYSLGEVAIQSGNLLAPGASL